MPVDDRYSWREDIKKYLNFLHKKQTEHFLLQNFQIHVQANHIEAEDPPADSTLQQHMDF